MASSPASPGAAPDLASPTAFALQELIACWDQGYEALARGDLDRVEALLGIADDHLRQLPPATADDPVEAKLRHDAISARGRLEHGMRSGLDGLREELAGVRRGSKMLQGYADPARKLGGNVESRA